MTFKKWELILVAALSLAVASMATKINTSLDQSYVVSSRTVDSDKTLWPMAINHVIDSVPVLQYLISISPLNVDTFTFKDLSRLRTTNQLFLPQTSQRTSLSSARKNVALQQPVVVNDVSIVGAKSAGIDQVEVNKEPKIHQVAYGETLWGIAINHPLEGVTFWQMAMSIYQLNRQSFVKNNISMLPAGITLVLPTLAQARRLSAEVAKVEYQRLYTQGAVTQLAKSFEVIEPVEQLVDNPVPLEESSPAPFILNKVTFTGNESFSAKVLQSVITDALGKAQNLEQLEGLAARITEFYRQQGYLIVRAILPPQTISQGSLTIHVIEAKYGRVALTNNSNVRDDLLVATAASMRPGMVISNANMYRTLLLLSDVPGVELSSTLSPGSELGRSDVVLVVENGESYSGSLSLDQHGNAYTGKERIIGSVAINNLASHGDVLSVGGMLSGENMQFGRVAYDWLLNGDGTHVGASYSGLNYRLGSDIESTKANGTNRTASLWLDQPLSRGLDKNFSMQLQADVNQLKDHLDAVSIHTDRTISSLSLTSKGDQKNSYRRGGISSWSVGLKVGALSFDDEAAKSADASSANKVGNFKKINFNINHLQSTSGRTSVYFEATGQWASHNLDSSEKLVAGGVNAVRGYTSGALSGDIGYVGAAEFRYYMTRAFNGGLTGSLYYDTAHIILNKAPWEGVVSGNSSTINSFGVALDWIGSKQTSVTFAIATPVEPASTLVSNHPSHTLRLKVKQDF